MGLLEGKRALIFGLANDHSIAWGIAQALHREGAEVGFSSVEMLMEKRVKPLAARLGATFVEPCDVQKDEDIERVFAAWKDHYGQLDILVHAVAFANKDELGGEFIRTSRAGFALAHDVSAYSLVALAREARPLMVDGGAILTLSYYGAEKAVVNYNVMVWPRPRPRPVCATWPSTWARKASASTPSAPDRCAPSPLQACRASRRCTGCSRRSRRCTGRSRSTTWATQRCTSAAT